MSLTVSLSTEILLTPPSRTSLWPGWTSLHPGDSSLQGGASYSEQIPELLVCEQAPPPPTHTHILDKATGQAAVAEK